MDGSESELELAVGTLRRELEQSRQEQAATSSILRIIASAPTDLQLVLRTVAETAAKLCDAYDTTILLRQGDNLVLGAHFGPIPFAPTPWPVSRDWVSGRSIVDAQTVHIPDLSTAGEEFASGRAMALRLGHRTTVASPLLR